MIGSLSLFLETRCFVKNIFRETLMTLYPDLELGFPGGGTPVTAAAGGAARCCAPSTAPERRKPN